MNSLLLATSRLLSKEDPIFLGEVSPAEFISGADLSSAIGLSAGNLINSTAGWLKFKDPVDGKIKMIAKRPLRRKLTWSQIHSLGAVYGTVTVNVGGKLYKVRLLKGASSDPATLGTGTDDPVHAYGSEWNRLLYLVSDTPSGISNEGIEFGKYAKYNKSDLGFAINNGGYNWCQESVNDGYKIVRGGGGVTSFTSGLPSSTDVSHGWRPVLELVE